MKARPSKPAGSAGGTCQISATAPASRVAGDTNFHDAQSTVARPASYGKVEYTRAPALVVTPAKRRPMPAFCAADRQEPARAPAQVGTARSRSNAAWHARVSWTM